MGEGQVPDVDPEVHAAWRESFLLLALHDVSDALVGGVEGVEGVEVVDYGAEDEGWTALDGLSVGTLEGRMLRVNPYRRKREVGLLLFYKVPCSSLGKSFACSIPVRRVLERLFLCYRIPVFFRVGVLRP